MPRTQHQHASGLYMVSWGSLVTIVHVGMDANVSHKSYKVDPFRACIRH